MDKLLISDKHILFLRKLLIAVLTIFMAILFIMPSKAYAAPVDTSSGIDAASMTDAEFRQFLVDQGFPDSYITPLMALHKDHPSWVFQAAKTGLNFESVITKESQPGINVVASSLPVSYRSKASGCYDSSTGLYISYDSGGWYTATPEVIRYYMDPRNFFDDYGIFQFMTHAFDSSTQTIDGLKNMVSTTFLRNAYPKVSGEKTSFETYSNAIYQAGQISGVNPYVIASIIIVEQGANGGGACISGTEPGYENIFNFFNIEAYAWGGRSAVTNGLIYAAGSGSYGRPWNTRYKSILGGGKFYYEEYVEPKQNTLYFKKFNVMNGLSGVATHQYMSNVQGAVLEGYRLKRGYDGTDTAITFVIPVYKNMPSSCPLPSDGSGLSDGNGYINDPGYEGVNIRSGAGTSYSIVKVFIGSQYVNVVSSETGTDGYTWFYIKYSGGAGYVRSDLIKVTGWVKGENGWNYYKSDGTMLKNKWVNDGKGWCWLDANGVMASSQWLKYKDEWYYLKANGYMAADQWINDGKGYYWLDSEGKMVSSQWIKDEGYWYYLKANGRMASSEWINDGKGRCWLESDGKMARSKWIKYDGLWYYVKSNGYMASNEWINDGKGQSWIEADGKMARSKWVESDGELYFVNSSGYMVCDGWAKDSNGWRWMGSDGRITKEQWIKYSEKWYYLKSDGYMATFWQVINGKYYYFHTSSGYMYAGGTFNIDGKDYTFASNGALQGAEPEAFALCRHNWDEGTITTEPKCAEDGVKTFKCSICGYTKTESIPALGHTYGEWTVVTEPTCVDKGTETRVCSRDSSHVETRDIEPTGIHTWDEGTVIKEATYEESGIITYTCTVCGASEEREIPILLESGWHKIDGLWYYYGSEGVALTGWQNISDKWYYFDESGIMQTGWLNIDNKYYYLKSSGAMASKEWVPGYWWINSSGTWTYKYRGSWRKSGDRWWFGDTSGWYAKSETLIINGVSYQFDESGWMIG